MKYAAKKILFFLLTLWLVSLLVFLSFQVIPGDPATVMLGTDATPEKVEALREEMGLNNSLWQRYISWALSFLQGDMGQSYRYHMPVSRMLLDKIPVTITLTLLSFLFTLVLSVPLGIFAAKHENKTADRVLTAAGQIIMAVPPFFLGILFTYLFGLVLKLFTPGGYVSFTADPAAFISYLIFPALAIALPKSAMTMKLLKTSIVKEKSQDYVRTAYSRGNHTNQVLYRHILKNAMLPSITFLGMTLTDMIAGSIIIEQVFSIPGLGRTLLTSISGRDYPVVMAIIVWIAFFVILTNLVVDVLYRIIDPRIREI